MTSSQQSSSSRRKPPPLKPTQPPPDDLSIARISSSNFLWNFLLLEDYFSIFILFFFTLKKPKRGRSPPVGASSRGTAGASSLGFPVVFSIYLIVFSVSARPVSWQSSRNHFLGNRSPRRQRDHFLETVKSAILRLLNFADAISTSKRMPEKLFKIPDLREAL